MNDYVIITDSASDLSYDLAKSMNIEIIPMQYMVDDKSFIDKDFNSEKFYNLLRENASSFTAQVNCQEFIEYFSKYLSLGKDIIYIGFPKSLSGMNNSAKMACEELKCMYPNRKVFVIDSNCASIGQGLLVYYASLLKKNKGLEIDELKTIIENIKNKFCHWFTVNNLYYLKKGGRISSAVAVIGSILNVKPLLSMNEKGELYLSEKVRGRKKVLDVMISKIKSLNLEYKEVFIGHADCITNAEYVYDGIKKEFPDLNLYIMPMGPIIGTHTGPDTIALAFVGNSR